MKTYKWTVVFEVDASWVADGFNLTQERAQEMIQSELPYATSSEVDAIIKSAPSEKAIAKEQGY